jgi:hypothetical protein
MRYKRENKSLGIAPGDFKFFLNAKYRCLLKIDRFFIKKREKKKQQ